MKSEVNEQDVVEFLKNNPAFFADRDSLLMKMQIPHGSKGTVSLVEKQMSVMRERQQKTRKQLNEFVRNAELNKEIFDKSSQLVLGLLATLRSGEFFSALEKGLKRDFKCKAYSLVIFGRARQINHFTSRVPAESAREYVGALMRARHPTLGVLRPDEQDFLFRHQSDKVKSAAVLSVRDRNKQVALLAIGSDDPGYFTPDMDTLFLGFIADVLARLLPRHLPR
ncbi:MAG: DUF484 family protein [Proteobacteria bacterium]|nr:DUF484 family protein [Pseudomonadota bacterium]